ncbi:ABC transporter substrate-binding protein [Desulfolithobacter dissulfuricans]|uniref:ABC transporter substrate-binding protein n=1 Tax=Desulfolithobacter dissulfuricans TaxID=2795293 RepID=A0A915XHI1_9BACT|nr:ABC transporter substrate-binding protein [Desulfolithobacter dissulfuricans]BCO08065.1 ABC transporter substrate-binding protein [Desulfolithobacter dissulfuricans]
MKRLLLCVALSFFALVQGVQAGEYRISVNQFVEHPALDSVLRGMQDYFSEHGVEVQWKVHNAQANMGTATQIAQQMIGEKADLLVAIATPSAQACAQALNKAPASMKRPLLFTAVTDPVAAGLVRDLQHPGGYITGVSDLLPVEKHVEMIREFLPGLKRLGVLYNAGEANSKSIIASLKKLCSDQGITVVEATASKTADVYQAAKSLVGQVDAVFIPTDNTIVSALESVIKVGTQNRLPIFAADVDSVARGAVAAMGFDYYRHGLQTGAMAHRILEGADPGGIPVEFQKDLELHINRKYATLMGVVPPRDLLTRAARIY